MGIEKVECYTMTCDNCKELYEEHYTGYTIFHDESRINESAEDWVIGADPRNDQEEEICLCDKCHHFNDKDQLIINESRFKAK